jgi:hypothetical protein
MSTASSSRRLGRTTAAAGAVKTEFMDDARISRDTNITRTCMVGVAAGNYRVWGQSPTVRVIVIVIIINTHHVTSHAACRVHPQSAMVRPSYSYGWPFGTHTNS